MKTFEHVLLLNPYSNLYSYHVLDPLQFAYQDNVGVEDAFLYLLHTVDCHLERKGDTVKIMFFVFSSALNTIQPLLWRDKLLQMGVEHGLFSWYTDYPTKQPEFDRLGNITVHLRLWSMSFMTSHCQ